MKVNVTLGFGEIEFGIFGRCRDMGLEELHGMEMDLESKTRFFWGNRR